MRAPLAFFIFSYLHLSLNGTAQGIRFGRFPKEDHLCVYESVRYKTGNECRLENASAYLKAGVQKLELFRGKENLVLMIQFDKHGRIVKSRHCGRSYSYVTITDSLFNSDSITVIDSFFYRCNLTRVDTTIIEHRIAEGRAKNTIRFDRIRYKSYKSGEYLNERNEYYRQMFKRPYEKVFSSPLPDHGRYSPRRRVDGNFVPYQRRRIGAWPRRPWTGKSYQWKKIYLAQTKTTYCNFRGATAGEQYSLEAKNRKKLFVPGEAIEERDIPTFYITGGNLHGCIRYPDPPLGPISTPGNYDTNSKDLIDTIYTLVYLEQAVDKPCVKPADRSFNAYLRGYSGEPKKQIDYHFRYTYFEE